MRVLQHRSNPSAPRIALLNARRAMDEEKGKKSVREQSFLSYVLMLTGVFVCWCVFHVVIVAACEHGKATPFFHIGTRWPFCPPR